MIGYRLLVSWGWLPVRSASAVLPVLVSLGFAGALAGLSTSIWVLLILGLAAAAFGWWRWATHPATSDPTSRPGSNDQMSPDGSAWGSTAWLALPCVGQLLAGAAARRRGSPA